MAQGWRTTTMFAAGAIAGGVVVLGIYLAWLQPQAPEPARPIPYSLATDPAPQSGTAPVTTAAAPAPLVPVGTCPTQPVAQAATPDDGLFVVNPMAAGRASTDPDPYLAVAREAMEQGRARDAEVALIAACHAAEQSFGRPSAPLADIKSQMGQHYVALASREQLDTSRESLLQRASALFAESADSYAAALGKNASKTRMAEQRLAALREPLPVWAPAAPLAVASPAQQPEPAVSSAKPDPDTSRLGASRSSSLAAPLRTEDLGKVESDLERLYNQARAVSSDPAGVQRRHEQALAQRSACRGDAQCLRDWAAQRKRQLFGEF